MGKRGLDVDHAKRKLARFDSEEQEVEWQAPSEAQSDRGRCDWPPGPQDVEALFNWPEDLLRAAVADPCRRSRLQELVQSGVVHSTDYSGIDSPREVCVMLEKAMRAEFAWGQACPAPLLRFARSCDWAKTPQDILKQISTDLDGGQTCVFPSLESRLPGEASALLDSLQPAIVKGNAKKAAADPDQIKAAESAYSDVQGWLARNKGWVYGREATSVCLVHTDRKCPSVPAQPSDLPSAVHINWAGTTCTGWTPVGEQLRYADPSERCHAVWVTERMQRALDGTEDMFFQENVPKYPFKDKLKIPLQDTHDVIRVVVGPEDLGWPSRRKRSLCCGLARAKWRWCGPTSESAVQAEFNRIFKRTPMLSGNSFLLAPPSEVRAWYAHKLANRGTHVQEGEPLAIGDLLEELLPPGARLRLDAYKKILEEGEEVTDFIADVEHWPHHAAACGSMFPCQLTHGTVVSLKGGAEPRVFLGSEHLCALGWHMFDGLSKKFQSPMRKILGSLSGHKQKALAGNAMALPAIAAFVLFIWSNIERQPSQEAAGKAAGDVLPHCGRNGRRGHGFDAAGPALCHKDPDCEKENAPHDALDRGGKLELA